MTPSIITTATKGLWLSLLLSSPACGSRLGEKDNVNSHEQQFNRSLAGFVLPFQITWRFVIAALEGIPERVGTEAEYEGVSEATVNWFTAEIPNVYENVTEFTFREVDCEVVDTVYDPTAEWVHEVVHNCEVAWDADSLQDTPDLNTFLVDMNADYLLNVFVEDYLRSANPQSPRNLFQFSRRVGYMTNDDPDATRGPLPPAADTPAPTEAAADTLAPTEAPMETTQPTPAAPGDPTPSPTEEIPQKKMAPPSKCGSLASNNDRGGAASDAKDCVPGRRLPEEGLGGRRKRKLKGSKY